MKITIKYLMLITALINLTACSSLSNSVPHSGPTMEQVYDGMGKKTPSQNANNSNFNNTQSTIITNNDNEDINQIAKQIKLLGKTNISGSSLNNNVSANAIDKEFHKLPNPEIKMYIFPHLAGSDQVPIPGYTTAFNVYEHDYYALPNEL